MRQYLIYGLLGLLVLASSSLAYHIGETLPIPALYTINGIPTSSYANITIYNPLNVTVVNNLAMIVHTPGLFYYDYTFPNLLGTYTVLVKFYNSSWDLQGSASDDLYVEYNYLSDINQSLNPNLPATYNANDTIWTFHCPLFVRVNETFTIWADYEHALNSSDVLNAMVNFYNATDNFTLTYNSTSSRYETQFTSPSNMTWVMNLSAMESPFDPKSQMCSIVIGQNFGLTVRLWEQVELKTEYQNKNYIITDENYNKQLTDPYINDFAWIIAKNNDHNASGVYKYCNVPIGSIQSLLNPIVDLLGSNATGLLTNDLKNVAGCEDYWFRAEYRNGSATIALPWAGNYSLYLLDGTAKWENDYSPPKIIKSNLFMDLGEINIPYRQDLTVDFWISHDELNMWASWTDSLFIWFITLLPILLFVGLWLTGFPLQIAGIIVIMLESAWFLSNILHFL